MSNQTLSSSEATARESSASWLPLIVICLALTLIHLISIPVTNTSVNPARSSGVALFADVGVSNRSKAA